MKILRLDLTAFGPFTDTLLDMGEGGEGLHLIYGSNEAGKSSALRALRQMLYGIPERSPDNFIHPYGGMRIGAALRHSDGDVLQLVRRKGRVNTLRSADDRGVIEEHILRKFLGGVDEEIFRTMFGIGHEDLVRGGRDLVEGGGRLGQVLFAAASGITDLRQVQADLQGEADLLFKPSAHKPLINETLARFRLNQRALREAQLPGAEWVRHDRALEEALKRKTSLEEDLDQKERTVNRLARIQEALPVSVRRKELLEALESCSDAVLLPLDFGERRRELSTSLRVCESEITGARQGIEDTTRELTSLVVSERILENVQLIEDLHKELGSHLKAAGDRTQLDVRKKTLESDVRTLLSGLRMTYPPEDPEALRLEKAQTVRIRELGALYERLMERRENARKDVSGFTSRIEGLEKQIKRLEEPRDVDTLRRILIQAERQAPLEEQLDSEWADIEGSWEKAEIVLGRQNFFPGPLEAIERLPLPTLETIDRFEGLLADAEGTLAGLQTEMTGLEKGLLETERQIEALRLEREVPTEKDLEEVRRLREEGWRLVQRDWHDGGTAEEVVKGFLAAFRPAKTLAEAFELSIKGADELADRLRREADRVARKAGLLAERTSIITEKENLRPGLEAALKERLKTTQEWLGVWEPVGVKPRSPREMRAWTQSMVALGEEISKLKQRRTLADALKARIETRRQELSEGLREVGEPTADKKETLSDLIIRVKEIIGMNEERRSERKRLLLERDQREGELGEAGKRVLETEKGLSEWKTQWAEAVRSLKLGEDATPAQAEAVIEDLKMISGKLKDTDILERRVTGIERDAKSYTERVNSLAGHVDPDLRGQPVERIVTELSATLTRARTAKTQQQGLEAQRNREKEKLAQGEKTLAGIRSRIAVLCEEAGCQEYGELDEAEALSERRRKIENELEDVDRQLHKLSGGATIEKFLEEVMLVDPDGIGPRMVRLKEENRQLHLEKSDLDQTIGGERKELARMQGSAQAADLAEEGQRLLARLEGGVEQYARLRVASAVLSQAIERYRDKNQEPVLVRAGELFAQLSNGSFEGIRADYDDLGNAVLVGVRPGGRDVVGTAGMSDGTADQLYLALRLASLDAYLKNNEPLPFIVDDILIRFDNDRAVAALSVLSRLSEKTQVIFFTHHRHLVEQAEAHVAPSVLFKHSLDR